MNFPFLSRFTSPTTKGVFISGISLMLVLVLIGAFSIYGVRERQISSWERQLDNISLTLSLQTAQALDTVNIVLDTVVDNIDKLDIKDEADFRNKLATKKIFDMLNERKKGLDQIDVVSIIASNGDNINFSRSYPVKGINLAERDYFQAHLKDQNLALFLGAPVRNKGNGKETFYLTKSIRDHQGHLLGLVIVGMSVDYLMGFYEKISKNIGENIVIILQRDDFTVFVRYPQQSAMVGKVNTTGPIYEVINNRNLQHGVVIIDTPRMSNGIREPRLAAVRKVEKYQLITGINVPLDEVLATWKRTSEFILGMIFSALVVIFMGMRYLIRAINIRESGYQKVQELSDLSERANIAKSRFIATMSHEIRTPLNGILGMAQLLLNKNLPLEDKNKYIQTIINSGKILQTLLNDILDFSKIEAGKMEFAMAAINPQEILAETTNLYVEQALRKNIQLSFEWQGPQQKLYLTDPLRLRQMLSNLILNAVKFTDHGQVMVIGREFNQQDNISTLEFKVIDTGLGIEEKNIQYLFKAFSQISSDKKFDQVGTGLGLSIVASILDAMGGDYGVESKLGKGSTFWIQIPAQLFEGSIASRTTDDLVSLSSNDVQTGLKYTGKVLVVEDNLTNQLVLSSMIQTISPSIEVLIADNGKIAVDMYLEHLDVDLILMDIGMPVMDGFEATTEIRRIEASKNLQRVNIVAVTAYVFETDRIKFLNQGMDGFIPKPIDIQELERALQKFLLKNKALEIISTNTNIGNESMVIFNYQRMLDRLGGNVQLSKNIVQSSIKEVPKFIDHLFESIHESNLIEAKGIIHTLKGLIGQLGGDRLEQILKTYDSNLRNGGSITIDDVNYIETSYKELMDEIRSQGIIHP